MDARVLLAACISWYVFGGLWEIGPNGKNDTTIQASHAKGKENEFIANVIKS